MRILDSVSARQPTIAEESTAPPRRGRLVVRLLTSPSVYIILGLLILGVGLWNWVVSIGGPAELRAEFSRMFGPSAPLVTVNLHIVLAITPFPSDLISIANGAMYGFPLGAGLSWFAWWIAALLEFGLGRRTRKDLHLEEATDRLPHWLRRFPVEHPVFLIVGRLVPWVGGHATTFVPGAAGVSWRRYVWCSAIGIIPGALLMPYIGAFLTSL